MLIELSKSEAINLALSSQLLLNDHPARTKSDLYKIIERLGYIQIDTISVVERAHKHILWTRFPEYQNELLDQLIDKDKKVFEFWDHAASYLPMSHYRYSLPRKSRYKKSHKAWASKNRKLIKGVLDRIKAEGPLQSRDFKDDNKRGLWWDWKPAKDALEYLFHSGELMVHARKNFQKVYDLTERVLPYIIDTSHPSDEEISMHLVEKAINSNGIVTAREITYLRHYNSKILKKVLNELIEDRKVIDLKIDGLNETYYTTRKMLNKLKAPVKPTGMHILSPFDNLVIQRKRLSDLFGFDYVIECYVPATKRKYGYFCLPVLYGDKFIARIDAKADRKSGEFRVINMFLEDKMKVSGKIKTNFERKLKELAEFSGCERVVPQKSPLDRGFKLSLYFISF